MSAHVTSIGLDDAASALLAVIAARLPSLSLSTFESAAEAWRALRQGDGPPDLVIIGPNEPSPTAMAERAISIHGALHVVVLTRAASHDKRHAGLSRSVLLGDAATSVSLDEPDAALAHLTEALERAAKQRRHRKVTTSIDARLASSAPAASRRGQYVEEIWKHAPIGVLVVDVAAGRVLDRNEQATALLALRPDVTELSLGGLEGCFPEEKRVELRALLGAPPQNDPSPRPFVLLRESGELVHIEMLVAGAGAAGKRLVILQDVTMRALAEEELRRKLALIEEQKAEIERLSTPILHVWERVLSLPIVGRLDAARATRMVEAVLAEVSRSNTEFVVVDLTGAPAVDSAAASGLLDLVQATRLLGATCLVSGMSAELARSIVDLGVQLHGITTFPSLYTALKFVLRSRPRAQAR